MSITVFGCIFKCLAALPSPFDAGATKSGDRPPEAVDGISYSGIGLLGASGWCAKLRRRDGITALLLSQRARKIGLFRGRRAVGGRMDVAVLKVSSTCAVPFTHPRWLSSRFSCTGVAGPIFFGGPRNRTAR